MVGLCILCQSDFHQWHRIPEQNQRTDLGHSFSLSQQDFFFFCKATHDTAGKGEWKYSKKLSFFFLLLIAFETPASETSNTAIVLWIKFEIISTRMQSVLFQLPGTCSVHRVDNQSKPSHAMWFVSKCIMKTSEEGLLGVSSSWENFQKKWFPFVSKSSLCVYLRSWAEMWACSWLTQKQWYSCHLGLHTYCDGREVFILTPSSAWFVDT